MSAELLRRAAALMRERAEAATPGPWLNRRGPGEHVLVVNGVVNVETANPREDRRHIASWHPAIALAVADWLDLSASDAWAWGPMCPCGDVCDDCDDNSWEQHARKALAVARAYLGEAADA